MADAVIIRDWDERRVTAGAAVAIGELWQLADGSAAYYERLAGNTTNPVVAGSSGASVILKSSGQVTLTKATSIVMLDGGRVYWDHSANAATYKKVNDRDFYVGRCVGDAASADASLVCDLNANPPDDIDIARDPFTTVYVGTQGLNTMGIFRRGGAHEFFISSTSEAQKLDMLSLDGFAKTANAIVEFAFRVISDGAGTVVDVSVGIADDTHATDADTIANSVFMHLDANSTNINFESDDGTTEVAATDSTTDYTEGSSLSVRKEVWMDLRNPADVQIYVDAVLVLSATVFDVNTSSPTWKLLAHIEKSSAADTYTFALDWLRCRFAEQ